MALYHKPGTFFCGPKQLSRALRRFKILVDTTALKTIARILGKEADLHLVGGTVRRVLLGQPPSDYDLSCALDPKESSALLKKSGIKVVATGLKHGTITAVLEGLSIEITAFRGRPALKPRAKRPALEDDLGLRDFTINSIAYSVNKHALVDPFNGLSDLRQGVVRGVVDAAGRFKEDPLRLLRMVRFGPAEKRRIEKSTLGHARTHAKLLKAVAPERIRAEFLQILCSACPAAALRLALDCGLLKVILPEISPAVGFEQNIYHDQDVFEHTLTVVEKAPPLPAVRLAALFHDLGKPSTLSIDAEGGRHFYQHETVSEKIALNAMKRLRFSKEQIKEVASIVRLHMRPIECGMTGVRRLMRDLGPYFENWRKFIIADAPPRVSKRVFARRLAAFDRMVKDEKARLARLNGRRLAINGHDLLKLGLSPGPRLGGILKQLEEIVLERPALNTREALLNQAHRLITGTKE